MMNVSVTRVLDQKTERVETVAAECSVDEAIALMNARRIGSVLVMDGDLLVGIFTERDVLTRVVPRQIDPRNTPVCDVMTRQLNTVSPSCTVQEAMLVMTNNRHRHLPIVQGGRLIGLVSIGDLTRWVVRDQQRSIEDLTDYIQRV
jgi:CBS domain-containing protein